MTFTRPTLSDLIERARADFETRLPGADARLRHSVLDVLARVHGGAAAGLYGYLDYLAAQILPDTADAEHLARHAAVWGIRRKGATPAVALATATGVDGTVIPAGAQARRADGELYALASAGTLAGGEAEVRVEAVLAGAAGDIEAGTLLTLTSPVAGVSATLTVTALETAGSDEEADDALRARLLDRIRQPPQGGSSADYVAWALAQPGVTRAWCYPQWLGLGTVGLTFMMDGREAPVPLAGDVAAVQAALDLLRPVTADLTVFAPATVAVDFTIRVSPDTPAIRAAITAELADFFAREAEPGGTLWRSRIGEVLSLADGEFNHVVELPDRDVSAPAGTLPVLGTVSFVA